MYTRKQIQHYKSVVRGIVEGDKKVAMVVLTKRGVKLPSTVVKKIRQEDSTDEVKMLQALDVYEAYESFIRRDRHDKYNDAEEYADKLVISLNQFLGRSVCTVDATNSSWKFKVGNSDYKYIRGKYTETLAKELYDFFTVSLPECSLLLRVYEAA